MPEAGLSHFDTTRAGSMSDEGGASGARIESQERKLDEGWIGIGAAAACLAGFGLGLLLIRRLARAAR
jgi:hypothetical protein